MGIGSKIRFESVYGLKNLVQKGMDNLEYRTKRHVRLKV